jgi:hypothetical protein
MFGDRRHWLTVLLRQRGHSSAMSHGCVSETIGTLPQVPRGRYSVNAVKVLVHGGGSLHLGVAQFRGMRVCVKVKHEEHPAEFGRDRF